MNDQESRALKRYAADTPAHAMFLIACPSCSRQYDATGLAPGSDVRCFCDEIFCVRWPDKLTGAALSCTNCGGAVTPLDESCPYCSSKISEEDRRKTTLCPKCFTRLDDDSKHCRACAVEIRPQRLSPLPVGRGCPRCDGELRVRSFGIVDVIECGDCLGLWLTPEVFLRVTEEAGKRNSGTELNLLGKGKSAPPRALETVRYIPCLTCNELMQRRQYMHRGRSSGTIIDTCRGHGVWLDHEEIEHILTYVARADETLPVQAPLDPAAFISKGRSPLPFAFPGDPRRRQSLATDFLMFVGDLLFGRW